MVIAERLVASLLLLVLLLLLGAGIPFAWILRDGLGPDAVESAGLHAFYRTFWTFYVGPLILILSLAWLVLFFTVRRGERRAARSRR